MERVHRAHNDESCEIALSETYLLKLNPNPNRKLLRRRYVHNTIFAPIPWLPNAARIRSPLETITMEDKVSLIYCTSGRGPRKFRFRSAFYSCTAVPTDKHSPVLAHGIQSALNVRMLASEW